MPDNGLFKPKHVAYFILYCELCRTTWKNKYIFYLFTGDVHFQFYAGYPFQYMHIKIIQPQ
jgi:hypothetical protein